VNAFAALVLCLPWSAGHPVARDSHDRTITVRLLPGPEQDQVLVRVEYRLEVDEATVVYDDMRPFADEVNVLDYRGKALAYYGEFARLFAPIHASRLVAAADGAALDWTCVSHTPRLKDEEGKELGHLRCDFVYEATFTTRSEPVSFTFEEKNYYDQAGKVVVNFSNEAGLEVTGLWVADDAFRQRAVEQPEPGDDDRLRSVRATLVRRAGGVSPLIASTIDGASAPRAAAAEESFSLLRLFLHSDHGFWLLLALACVYGAAHALTPGHGKTLVAAYLVGERGTIGHAVVLGVVTTLTHTGAVLVLAALLFFLPAEQRVSFQHWIEKGLGLAMGLMVTGMGFWLLLQRLAGRADHIHIGGGHHHHHDYQQAPAKSAREVSWWGVILLGIAGGMIPCGDAVLLLLYTAGQGQLGLVLPALLAFSAGLAGVLVLIGILVVQVPRFARSHWGEGRLLRSLPILSALFITAMGLWLCYEGTHPR
jgi:nickel/cobalt exporter